MSNQNPLLLRSLDNFEGSDIIDNIHLTCIDLNSEPVMDDVETFLAEAHTYLEKDLPFNTINELSTAISLCFSKFPKELLNIYEDYFKKSKTNSNYIIVNSSILFELVHSNPQLNLPNYHPFVDDALKEILPQLQIESNLIVFSHTIPQQLIGHLVLNLILLSDLTSKLATDFFPFIFSRFLFSKNSKFELLIQNLSKTGIVQILPQTEQSNQEIIDFITKYDKRLDLVLKMSQESLSLIEFSVTFIQSNGQIKINGLNQENFFQFLSISMIYLLKKNNEFVFKGENLSSLILNATNFLIEKPSPVSKASLDFILMNFNTFYRKFPDSKAIGNMIGILLKSGYTSEKVSLLIAALDFCSTDSASSSALEIADVFQYFTRNISTNKSYANLQGCQFDLKNIDSNLIIQYLNEMKGTDEIDSFFFFIEHTCKNIQDLITKISPSLIDLIRKKIHEGKKNDALIIARFMKRMKLGEKLNEIEEINKLQFDSIDDVLSQILKDRHPEQNEEAIEALFNKMVEDKELLLSYLCCYVFKYGKLLHQLNEYEKLFTDEYKRYGEVFIEATNKVFYYQNIRKVMLTRPDFKVTSLPVSESGRSVILKLFEIIEKNPCENYQAFFCLKIIASSFPFLFSENSQQIFDLVLPSFDNFQLVYDKNQTTEKAEIMKKTSICALEFLFSTLYSTIVFDNFIKWFFNKVDSLSCSQFYALITLFQMIYKDNLINIYFQAFVRKYDFLNTVNQFLEKEIKEVYFVSKYKKNLYSFIKDTFDILLTANRADCIYFYMINEADFPVTNIYENIYHKIPICFETKSLIIDLDSQLKNFADNVHRSRIFWLNNESKKSKIDDDLDEIMNDFDQKLEVHEPLPPGGDRPTLYCAITVRMIKYFFDKPSFCFSWCINSNIIPVVLEMYQIVLDCLKDLNEMNNNKNYSDPDDDNYENYSIEDEVLPFFCQHNLFKKIVDDITNLNTPYAIFSILVNIIKSISKKGYSLMSLFEFLSQTADKINDEHNISFLDKKFSIILHIFLDLKNYDAFKNNFVDMCGNNLLNISLSPDFRTNSNILYRIFTLLNNCENIPKQSIYLASFMILSGDNDLITNGIEFLSKINPKDQEIINSTVLIAFDKLLDENVLQTKRVKLMVDNCPSVLNERRKQLMDILINYLDTYFTNVDKNQNDDDDHHNDEEEEEEEEESNEKMEQIQFIGFLFTKLAPPRGISTSLLTIVDESSSIPIEIMETSPGFWKVYEKYHAKILSKIEKKPFLLNHFHFLLDYPELISFKIRSTYFTRKMNRRINKYSDLRFRVNINDLLSTSFRQLHAKKSSLFLNNFYVIVEGEGGDTTIDAGGVTRQWFTKLAKEMFNPNYGLFQLTKKLNFFPSPSSNIHSNHLEYFRFAGRFVARAIIEGVCIDAHFTSSFCKQILHREPNMRDLADIDDELFTNFEFTLSNKNVEQQDMVFAIDRDEFGNVVSFPLKENGENIEVTNENKKEYVDLYVDFILRKEIEKQIKAFCEGFDELIPHNDIKMFTPNELDMIICGIDNIDVDDFIAHTICEHPYTKDSPVIKMFFNLLRKWDNEKLAKLLFFMTGATHLPPSGFKGFCESSGHLLRIQAGGKTDSLPKGHTCFNAIDLPPYENEEIMSRKLLMAIYECDSITNY